VRRAAGPARRTNAPRRPPQLSGRAVALGLLLVALVLAYAYPVRTYLAQQAEIDQLQQAEIEQRKRIQDLNDALARWEDPEYVAAQARARLQICARGRNTS
jgi:cell division protein FtsB